MFSPQAVLTISQIGDPKMDSGCSAFDPEPEEEFDPARPTSAEETIWLMDELMYREVSGLVLCTSPIRWMTLTTSR